MGLRSGTRGGGGMVLGLLLGGVAALAGNASLEDAEHAARVSDTMMEGVLLMQNERYAEAAPKLEWVIEQDARRLGAWDSLGWCYLALGRPEDARALWERLVRIDPLEPRGYNLLGKLAVTENRLDEAEAYFHKSLELQPDQAETRFALGRMLRWQGRLDHAAELLESLLPQDPERTDIVYELATALVNNWQFSAALPYWEQLVAAAPGDLEYRAMQALCLLHSNRPEEAIDEAGWVLNRDRGHVTALEVMANAYEMGEEPARAVEYLERWLDQLENPERERLRVRLIRLYVRLHRAHPHRHTLTRAIALTRERLDWNPDLVDAHLLLGELLLMEHRYDEAEEAFSLVLEEYNPHNLRAFKGLFECHLAARRYRRAREALEEVVAFNPKNPYLDYYWARYHAARGAFYPAGEALDRLEASGRQGAVGVLLVHGLVESDYFPDALSVRRFREHLEALLEAGFDIVRSSEIPEHLEVQAAEEPEHSRTRRSRREYHPPMLVAIDFDDGRVDSMRYGTPIAQELGLVFAMNLPVGYMNIEHPFIITWDDARRYLETGVWEYGSHFYDGAILTQIDTEGTIGPSLPNRIWLPEHQRLETVDEYRQRLDHEFAESRAALERRLGTEVSVISYPFGDIGQNTGTNVEDPTPMILAAGQPHYRIGFIQSEFGYAVMGDEPMLYQRHEMERWQGGEDTVDHLFKSHPVYLARRMRAEFAALAAKRHQARRTLRQLGDTDYAERPMDEVSTYVRRRMSRRMAAPRAGDARQQGFFKVRLSQPYIGVEGERFRDSLHRRNWRVLGKGGLHLTPYISVEGKRGRGRLKQGKDPAHLVVDEESGGLAANILFPNGMYITGEFLQRDLSSPAADDVRAYALTGYLQPLYLLDVQLRYEHDLVPAARAAVEHLRYDALMAHAVLGLQDWWDVTGSVMFFDFTDDNRRDHLLLATRWLLWERTGFKLGLSYSYTDAEKDSRIYWSPYQLTRYFIEGGFQGNYLRTYYNFRLRYGRGRQRQRPERIQQRQELEERARRLRFDPGPPLDEPGWEPIYGVSASTRMPLGKHWVLNAEYSYNRLPDYYERTLLGGLIYRF